MATLGVPGGYVNTSIPFGGENVGSVILDMKRHGVDGAYLAMDNNTNFAVANAAIQNGLTFKALVMATGYDESALQNPTTLATLEHSNVFLASNFTPYEAQPLPPGVTRMQNVFQKYLGIAPTTHPVFGYWVMYADAQLLIDGLMAAGRNPTRQGFVDAVRSFDNWNDDGIMCAGVSFTQATYGTIITRPGCSYIINVQNGKFAVVQKVAGHNIAPTTP
jgi:ABC-type branched-subunit amino acid transport system substrate-binding protein